MAPKGHSLLPKEGHIVFIQDRFLLGGIEVLEIKIAKELSAQGFEITVALNEADGATIAGESLNVFTHRGYSDLISRSNELILDTNKSVVLATLHPSAAMAALCVAEGMKCTEPSVDVRFFQWVSHSRAFFFSGAAVSSLLKKAFFLLPKDSTYFMSKLAREIHSAHWNKTLEEYGVLQIAGRNPTAYNTSATTNVIRIVSVGRLVPFKSYNRHAPTIVEKLRSEGLDVTWDIWGYGPDESIISEEIDKLGVSSSVTLRGALDHSLFDETVSEYDVFIGVGTAALEAGKTKTPTIVAAENSGDHCYGFIFETPAGSIGEVVDSFPQTPLIDCIMKFCNADEIERRLIGRLCSRGAYERESSTEEFCNAIIHSSPAKQERWTDRLALQLFRAYFWIMKFKRYETSGT